MKIMKKRILLLIAVAAFTLTNGYAQLNEAKVTPNLKKHITTLASDEYGGREPGTKGEVLAYTYISKQFKEIGLKEKGTNGYLQEFKFVKSVSMDASCAMTINSQAVKANDEFFLLPYSNDTTMSGVTKYFNYGIISPKNNYNDYSELQSTDRLPFILVMEYGTPDHAGPHSKYSEDADIRTRIDNAIKFGATGVIFINSNKDEQDPEIDFSKRITVSKIPVAFVKGAMATELKNQSCNVTMTTKLYKEEVSGHNIIGFIDNKAEYTVVIGAHYDHLGLGGHESLYRGEPAVHNGADDNASGTAALIELARFLKSNGPKGNNYLIMAYSGEEKGLLGSGYFVKNPTLSLSKMNYMLNMDMVGRLKKEDPTVLINGVGTSDAWKITMNYIKVDSLKAKTTESGVGPSDHTSFYLKDIPVLHFFSGTHNDYHKPSDDENLINYPGEVAIMNYIVQLVQRLDDKGKLNFIKTKEETNEDAPRFKVTLGVVPDYAFDGAGMRIDGVSENKPASKAGLKAGDVVTQIGEEKVVDMMSYMKALGKFSKGDVVPVKILREKVELVVSVTF
jgi:hypothetical protein